MDIGFNCSLYIKVEAINEKSLYYRHNKESWLGFFHTAGHERCMGSTINKNISNINDINKFNSLDTFLRSTAIIMKMAANKSFNISPLTQGDLEVAKKGLGKATTYK